MVQRVQHGPAALIPLQLFRHLVSDYLSRQEHPAVEHGQSSPVFSAGKQLHAGTVTPSLLEAAGGMRGRLRMNGCGCGQLVGRPPTPSSQQLITMESGAG